MKKSDMNYKSGEIGDFKEEHKKRSRKSKKQNDKQIINEFFDTDREHDSCFYHQRCMYENMNHLSQNEKNAFENKFTTPKNASQEEYNRILKNKSKKIVIATGPAGTGKTLFATEYGVKNFLLGNYDKLIFTRPSVSVDEDLGFLP
jgi:phosphate starvation-inducible protein PhoH